MTVLHTNIFKSNSIKRGIIMKNVILIGLFHTILICEIFTQTQPSFEWVKINGSTVNWNSTTTIEMTTDETFSLKTKVRNTGDDSPAYYNNISYSFPQFTSSSDKIRVSKGTGTSSDLDYNEYWGDEANGGDGYANYVMVEVCDNNDWDGKDWGLSEANEFEVIIKPQNYGSFTIYIRSWANTIQSWDGGTYEPSSSDYRDCINLPTYKITVNISEPQEITNCYWSTSSISGSEISNNRVLESGDKIYLNIHSLGFSSVRVKVYEDEGILSNDLVDEFTVDGLSDGFGYKSWYLPWTDDGLTSGLPEYYFKIEDNNDWISGLVQVDDRTAPSVPELTEPDNNQNFPYNETNIYFNWENSVDNEGYGTGVNHYHIQVSTNPEFSSVYWQDDREYSNASHTFSPNRTYYWRVNATDNEGGSEGAHTSNYSNYRKFIIDPEVGWIEGTVYKSGNTGYKVQDAKIYISGSVRAITDGNGEYRIELVPGMYDLTCCIENCEDRTEENIQVTANNTTTVNFPMDVNKILFDINTFPEKSKLLSIYPNPFNMSTTIPYSLREKSIVSIEVYNIKGQKIISLVKGCKEAGYWTATWDGKDLHGRNVCSGIYICCMIIDDLIQTKRIVLIK